MAGIVRTLLDDLRRQRRLLVALLIGLPLIGATIGHWFPIHEVRAYLRFHALDAEVYRQGSYYLSETDAIRRYFAETAPDEPYAERFLKPGLSGQHFESMVAQVYPPVRKDTGTGARSGGPATKSSVGLVLAASGSGPAMLEKQVLGMASCLIDTFLLTGFREMYLNKGRANETALIQNQANLTKLREDLVSLDRRLKGLRTLIEKYPDSAKIDNRQVVDVRGEASKYVPLPLQVVAMETSLVDTVDAVRRNEQVLAQMRVLSEYLTGARLIVSETSSRSVLTRRLEELRAKVFTHQRLAEPIIADALNTVVDAENEKLFEFASLPPSTDRFKKFGVTLGALIALGLGLLLAMTQFVARLIYRNPEIIGFEARDSRPVSTQIVPQA